MEWNVHNTNDERRNGERERAKFYVQRKKYPIQSHTRVCVCESDSGVWCVCSVSPAELWRQKEFNKKRPKPAHSGLTRTKRGDENKEQNTNKHEEESSKNVIKQQNCIQ